MDETKGRALAKNRAKAVTNQIYRGCVNCFTGGEFGVFYIIERPLGKYDGTEHGTQHLQIITSQGSKRCLENGNVQGIERFHACRVAHNQLELAFWVEARFDEVG